MFSPPPPPPPPHHHHALSRPRINLHETKVSLYMPGNRFYGLMVYITQYHSTKS